MASKDNSLLRVTGGDSKGTKLQLVPGVRPMPSRMKQALFNILGDRLTDAAVLDLFAGTGSLGIEAASRGAGIVVQVEKNIDTCQVASANVAKAHQEERCIVLCGDAYDPPQGIDIPEVVFTILFLDPPYAQSEDDHSLSRLVGTLETLVQRDILARSALIILHARADTVTPDTLPPGIEPIDTRCYGTGGLIICRLEKKSCT